MAEEKKNPMFNSDLFKFREPVKLFDDLYFAGNSVGGVWISVTSEGLVLIEGGGQDDFWEACLQPSLEKLGLADRKVLLLLLTHGPFDHYGGAYFIRKATGCDVCLSAADTVHITAGLENQVHNDKNLRAAEVTKIISPGDDLVFGDHVISVLDGAGHTPGCLNYSMEVHDGEETHRFIMMGGYGIFGPGKENFLGLEYPFGPEHAVEQALIFASTCVKTWEYVKKNHCDIYFNPHPHLCAMFQHVEENKNRKPGEPNAFVIGEQGVREWLQDRFDACLQKAVDYTDIRG